MINDGAAVANVYDTFTGITKDGKAMTLHGPHHHGVRQISRPKENRERPLLTLAEGIGALRTKSVGDPTRYSPRPIPADRFIRWISFRCKGALPIRSCISSIARTTASKVTLFLRLDRAGLVDSEEVAYGNTRFAGIAYFRTRNL